MKSKNTFSQYFISLQGEGRFTGQIAYFLRYSGCNLRCPFCDTKFSWKYDPTLPDIYHVIQDLEKEKKENISLLVLTGGEPLMYDFASDVAEFVKHFNIETVNIETNGIMIEKNFKKVFRNLLILKDFVKNINITISPKITEDSHNLSEIEIYLMYRNIFESIDFLKKNIHNLNVDFKLIYDAFEKYIRKGSLNNYIELITSAREKSIFLMPMTYFDKKEIDKSKTEKCKRETIKFCLENGLNYSPRLHIEEHFL